MKLKSKKTDVCIVTGQLVHKKYVFFYKVVCLKCFDFAREQYRDILTFELLIKAGARPQVLQMWVDNMRNPSTLHKDGNGMEITCSSRKSTNSHFGINVGPYKKF